MSNAKVVFVSGVSSGIGRATAQQFAHRGCTVFGSVRDLCKAQAIPGVELIEMDVREESSVQRAVQGIIGKAKRIDVLVNNAGGTMLGAVEGMSETLDHEVRNFGIRVTLVEPSYTKTNLDLNAPEVASRISAYDSDRDLASRAIAKSL